MARPLEQGDRIGTQGGGTIRGSQQSALGWNFEI